MIRKFQNPKTQSQLLMMSDTKKFGQQFMGKIDGALLTLAWNNGPDSKIIIDNIEFDFPSQSVIPLMANNNFEIPQADDIVLWQFNKDFYCIVDHDKEVSCVGFIFYGNGEHLFIKLDDKYQQKLSLLKQVFEDEFDEQNDIKEDMLRMLLKRLIILVTRLGKAQHLNPEIDNQEEDTIRQFNLLLENHFKEYHQVQDYANLLHKSPKTLSNLFHKYNEKSPIQVIKNRLVLEAKRLLYYTDKTSKEIAFELGFDDPSTFSRFFKNAIKISPTQFKKEALAAN